MANLPLRPWCDALGTTQAEVARRSGIPPPVLSDYARGRRNPTVRTLERIANVLGCKAWEILRGPLPGQGLPSEEESRISNIRWFRRLTPSQKQRASEFDRAFIERARRSRGSR